MTNLTGSDLAGLRIRETRKLRGWTVRDLAGQCAEARAPHITATVITNLETRRRATREITVDELLILAYVLDVPPIQLITPLDGNEQLEIAPGIVKDGLEAPGWIADDVSVLGPVRMARDARTENNERTSRWLPHADVLTVLRQIREIAARIRQSHAELSDPQRVEQHPGEAAYNERVITNLGGRLLPILGWLEASKRTPPALPDVMAILTEHGVSTAPDDWDSEKGDEEDSEEMRDL